MFNGLDLLYCVSIAFCLLYIVVLSRRLQRVERFLTEWIDDNEWWLTK